MKREARGQGPVPWVCRGVAREPPTPDFSVSAKKSLGEVREIPWLQNRPRGQGQEQRGGSCRDGRQTAGHGWGGSGGEEPGWAI